MTNTRFYLIVVFVAVAIFVGAFWLVEVVRTPPKNPCIAVQPHEVVSGHIYHYGMFSKGTVYYLNYKGAWKLTGDECAKRCAVTEAEYDRRMYREKN